ncbi:fibronectin type III domain-containing protein [Acidobacteria bacterium AH-259-O06]|nr:fibronectin type III domain-containing protein [Acidobacteria bacterium AH-259-O06]
MDLSWLEPGGFGGSPITGYQIERRPCAGTWAVLVANTGTTATTYSDTAVVGGTCYGYRVSAINGMGTGSASTEATVTPLVVQGEVIYGDKQTNQILYDRGLGGTAFGNESTLSLGGFVGWADLEASPTDANRLLRGVLEKTTLDVKTSIFDLSTGNWTEITTVTLNTGNGGLRLFDIEFEQSTADALIVYGDNTAGSIKYRTMLSSASDWGTEQTLSFTGGVPRTVRAVRDPDTDDIMVGWEDAIVFFERLSLGQQQAHYRWRNDDGGEGSATWAASRITT